MSERVIMRYIKLSITKKQVEIMIEAAKKAKNASLVDKLNNAYTFGKDTVVSCSTCAQFDDPCDPEGCSSGFVNCDAYNWNEKSGFGTRPELKSLPKLREE